MANSKNRKTSVKFRYSVEVQASLPEFQLLESVSSLDPGRRSKGTSNIEVGFFKGGCCRKMVRAKIRDGMVVGLEVEPCKDCKPASGDLSAILKEAHRRLSPKAGKWQAMPVSDFLQEAAALVVIHGGCIQICIHGYCITCCVSTRGFGCTTEPIYIGPL